MRYTVHLTRHGAAMQHFASAAAAVKWASSNLAGAWVVKDPAGRIIQSQQPKEPLL